MKHENQEIIYVFTNQSFPDWVKIGRCSNVDDRLKSLSNNTAVPLPFECFYACTVNNGLQVERQVHSIFYKERVSERREFFKIDPEKAVSVLQLVAINEVTPNNEQCFGEDEELAINKEISENNLFNFSEAEITLGSKIYFTRDPSIEVTVIDQHRVSHNGKDIDFTLLTRKILKGKFGKSRQIISTPRYWSYKGEMLVTRKHRITKERKVMKQ